mmetsp:Transcript_2656/g.5888  ORF Transcript_2656/g.5888 Transcript_2656/m.5888 type:complete len:567 (-) Transcript_2656:95-1795(-)
MPLGKGASRHTVGGSRRGTITHLLALSLGISLGSFISNLGGPLGLSGYFGSPREAGEGSGTGGTPNPARSGAERGGHFDARQDDAPGTYAEWISRVMPPSLAPVYVAPGALPFNLTMSILRRTRPVVGSTDRVRGFLTKLKKGQCTTSLMLGGSVTAGHNGGGPSNAYPKLFVDYLNARFPCTGADGGSGEHVYKTTNAGNSMSHATSFSSVSNLDRIDLILVEFNVNDHFMPGKDVPHALEDKGPWSDTLEYRSLWYSEMLLRKLLLLRKPDYPAIVVFNADYIGRIWAGNPWSDPKIARRDLFRYNQEPLKLWLSFLYDIPVFSASLFHLALASKLGTDVQFNFNETRDGHNPYGTNIWHADACCHPKADGHRVLALVLVYNFADELWRMDHDGSVGHEDRMEGDFTIDPRRPRLRDPVYMSPDEDGLYVRDSSDGVTIDLTDPNGEDAWRSKVVANEGWTWFADNKDKDKYGLIADDRAGGAARRLPRHGTGTRRRRGHLHRELRELRDSTRLARRQGGEHEVGRLPYSFEGGLVAAPTAVWGLGREGERAAGAAVGGEARDG